MIHMICHAMPGPKTSCRFASDHKCKFAHLQREFNNFDMFAFGCAGHSQTQRFGVRAPDCQHARTPYKMSLAPFVGLQGQSGRRTGSQAPSGF